jgi:hypothetical protein
MTPSARVVVRSLCGALALLAVAGLLLGCATTEPRAATTPQVISTLADLDTLATNTDAVFVYVPAKGGSADRAPAGVMAAAARKMRAQDIEVGLFALQAGSDDQADVAKEVELPCVLTLIRGRGGIPVTGKLTGERLVKSFDGLLSGGGCGEGGCGSCGAGPSCGAAAEACGGEGCQAPEKQ